MPQADTAFKLLHTFSQIEAGMKYCLKVGVYTVYELSAYLLYRFGETLARRYLSNTQYTNYKKRADKIKEEQNGRY